MEGEVIDVDQYINLEIQRQCLNARPVQMQNVKLARMLGKPITSSFKDAVTKPRVLDVKLLTKAPTSDSTEGRQFLRFAPAVKDKDIMETNILKEANKATNPRTIGVKLMTKEVTFKEANVLQDSFQKQNPIRGARPQPRNVMIDKEVGRNEVDKLRNLKDPGQLKKPRIIDVTLVAMAPPFDIKADRETNVEPLPPVQHFFKEQVAKIERSQSHYLQLFKRVNSMLETLNKRYDGREADVENVDDIEYKSDSSLTAKRKCHNMSSSSLDRQDFIELHSNTEKVEGEYPKRIRQAKGDEVVVLGPNGTQITSAQFDSVDWATPQVATRGILMAVFTSDELATHTLTGKPSPAFYGRERPAKMQLDPLKVDDIITAVTSTIGGKERHIRSTITTKCADTAKKYRRRAKKATRNTVIVLDN
ncbi:early boundary activity protein 2 [Scaptodrosophila lebanonensis]|uniref:Early boundary activity protein 2 n=1 Tax=Drosophila lebanonensis TaxID=7225 RepID=A0A6J2U5S7_DROLE|nr:early boundary activity protein 2 [Scaptodrosophila lebanonensis]